MKGDMHINPYVSDLRAEEIKFKHLKPISTYEWGKKYSSIMSFPDAPPL